MHDLLYVVPHVMFSSLDKRACSRDVCWLLVAEASVVEVFRSRVSAHFVTVQFCLYFLGVVSTAAAHQPSLTLSLCPPRDVRSH